jgi:uncharacterized protein YoxC
MLFSLGFLFLYLCAVLNSIRRNLRSIEKLTYQEVGVLLRDVDQTVKTVNEQLPELLKNVNEITASVQRISESEIQPMTHHIQEITEVASQNVAKIDELIDVLTEFSETTVKRASYYRDQLAIPVADIISAWSGVKAGWEVLSQHRKGKTSAEKHEGSKDSTV